MKKLVTLYALLLVVAIGAVLTALIFRRPAAVDQAPVPEAPRTAEPSQQHVEAEAPAVIPPPPPAPPAEVPSPTDPTAEKEKVQAEYFGVVQRADTGATLPAAKVAFLSHDEVVGTATTDEEGAYTLTVSVDEWQPRRYTLTCEVDGFSRVIKSVEELEDHEAGRKVRLDFALEVGAGLSGRILESANGAPVAGIGVQLNPHETGFSERRFRNAEVRRLTAVSDEEGAYRIASVPPGVYVLMLDPGDKNFVLAGAPSQKLNFAQAESKELDLRVESGAVVQGNVTAAAGELPEDTGVMATPDISGQFMERIFEMALNEPKSSKLKDGQYEVAGLRFGQRYRVTARAKGFAAASSEPFSIARGRSPHTINFELVRGSSITGVVQYEDGTPAPEVDVMLMPDFGKIMSGDFAGVENMGEDSGADGSFVIAGVSAGKYTLMAGKPSFPFMGAGENTTAVEVDGVNDVTGLVLTVDRPSGPSAPGRGEISGVVQAADGLPVPSAKVEAMIFGVPVTTATTGEDGTFKISGLRPSTYDLTARKDKEEASLKKVELGSNVTLKMAPATHVSGLVVNASGESVAQCRVHLEKLTADPTQFFDPDMIQGMIGMGGDNATTNEFGYFEIAPVKPGRYTAKAMATGRGSGESDSFEVKQGTDVDSLRITLEAGVRFSGTVKDTAGQAVAGADISLFLVGAGNFFQEQMAQFMPAEMQEAAATGISEETGAFLVENLSPGTYRVSAAHPNYAKTRIKELVLEPARDVAGYIITLSQGGCLTGVPLMNGEPKPGLMVQAIGGGGMQMANTDDSGRFELCGLSPDKYMIQVMDMNAMMSGNFMSMMPVQRTAEVRDGETTEVEFGTGPNAVQITGTVSGERKKMTTISLRKPDSPDPAEIDPFDMAAQMALLEQMGGTAIVAEDGTFTLPNVEPGDYILEVHSLDFDMQNLGNLAELMESGQTPVLQQNITVVAGESPELQLEIPAAEE
ncbi:MAG: carboxypeptidase regulatory-like domain-containing protein [Candidatus Hydrogenedentes bacterium]|nr:carboxypeptidase regulatory-like domain-containing protein [Candidatus Hydrogenedentota bacterium]